MVARLDEYRAAKAAGKAAKATRLVMGLTPEQPPQRAVGTAKSFGHSGCAVATADYQVAPPSDPNPYTGEVKLRITNHTALGVRALLKMRDQYSVDYVDLCFTGREAYQFCRELVARLAAEFEIKDVDAELAAIADDAAEEAAEEEAMVEAYSAYLDALRAGNGGPGTT